MSDRDVTGPYSRYANPSFAVNPEKDSVPIIDNRQNKDKNAIRNLTNPSLQMGSGTVVYSDAGSDRESHFISAGNDTYYMLVNNRGLQELVKNGFLSQEQSDRMLSELRRPDQPESGIDKGWVAVLKKSINQPSLNGGKAPNPPKEPTAEEIDFLLPKEQRLFVVEAAQLPDKTLKATRAFSGTYTPLPDRERWGGNQTPYVSMESTIDLTNKTPAVNLEKAASGHHISLLLQRIDPYSGHLPTESMAAQFKGWIDERLKKENNLQSAIEKAKDTTYQPTTPEGYRSPATAGKELNNGIGQGAKR